MRKIIIAITILLLTASFAAADTLYLRDGRTIRGTLLGFINGRFVVRVERRYATNTQAPIRNPEGPNRTDEQGEIQFFRPDEVERIEIEGRSLEDTRFEATTVQVSLESNWIDTGINLRRNQRVQIDASGVITVGRARITPDGLQRTDPTAPLPGAREGELIGAIGDDSRTPIMELGSSREFTAERGGRLYLTVNRGSYTDAHGSFTVQIKRERGGDSTGYDRGPGRIRSRDRQPVEPNQREVTINVPGISRGTDTGIDVRAGDPITLTAAGTIIAGQRVGQVGPDGATGSGFGSVVNARPLSTAGVGALIAYVRLANGQLSQPYLVGSQLTGTVPADGRLILAINDDNYGDNSGSFSVRIRY
jgi:PA-IL-like protein